MPDLLRHPCCPWITCTQLATSLTWHTRETSLPCLLRVDGLVCLCVCVCGCVCVWGWRDVHKKYLWSDRLEDTRRLWQDKEEKNIFGVSEDARGPSPGQGSPLRPDKGSSRSCSRYFWLNSSLDMTLGEGSKDEAYKQCPEFPLRGEEALVSCLIMIFCVFTGQETKFKILCDA